MIYTSKQWINDIDLVLGNMDDVSELNDRSVLITGATGLICSAVIDLLIRYNETHVEQIRIIAAARSYDRVKDRFGIFCNKAYFEFVPYDATDKVFSYDGHADYIIHGASNATPGKIIKEPVETMVSNFIGIEALLEYAQRTGTERLLYISSSEIYGLKVDDGPFHEDAYGFVDILNPRSSYPVAKRAAETLCASYSAEYGFESVIVRPGHIYGPTATRTDNRVSSVWAYDAAEGRDIVMKSDGSQIRSYCHCLDCASAILKVLLKGEPSQAYNIANPNSKASIREMAEILTENAGVKLLFELPSEDEKKAFNPMNNSTLDSSALVDLGWTGVFDAQKGFAHTIKVIKESIEGKC